MIRINLLPVRDLQKKEKIRDQIVVAALALGVVLLACGGLYAAAMMKIGSEKSDIKVIQTELDSLKVKLGKVAEFKKFQKELQDKLEVLKKLKEDKSGPARMLDELSKAMPEKVWLTAFNENDGSIHIEGVSLNEQDVASFLQRMEASPLFMNVELSVTEQSSGKGLKLQKFKASCKVESSSVASKTPSAK